MRRRSTSNGLAKRVDGLEVGCMCSHKMLALLCISSLLTSFSRARLLELRGDTRKQTSAFGTTEWSKSPPTLILSPVDIHGRQVGLRQSDATRVRPSVNDLECEFDPSHARPLQLPYGSDVRDWRRAWKAAWPNALGAARMRGTGSYRSCASDNRAWFAGVCGSCPPASSASDVVRCSHHLISVQI
jgi:hypothetical protein